MTGSSVYPLPSTGGSSYSSQPPENASSVLIDGQLVTVTGFTATITGTGGSAYIYSGANSVSVLLSGTTYIAGPNSVVATTAFSGATSVNISVPFLSISGSSISALVSGSITGTSTYLAQAAFGYFSGVPYFTAIDHGASIGQPSSGAAYSNDGVNWIGNGSSMPTTDKWNGITYAFLGGTAYFLANAGANGTSSNTAYSTNGGQSWTLGSLPGAFPWSGMASISGVIAVGIAGESSSSNATAYTTNGTSWTGGTMPSSQQWTSLTVASGYFIAMAQNGATSGAYSTNGTTWTSFTHPSNNCFSSAYGNNVLISPNSGAYSNTAGVNGYIYSTAIPPTTGTWSTGTFPVSISGTGDYWNGMTYGGGYFLMGRQNYGTTLYSTNGSTWSIGTSPYGTYFFAYGNNTFVSVNQSIVKFFKTVQNFPVSFGIYNGPTGTY